MAFPTSLNPTTPGGSASPAQGDDQIRALKQLIADVLGIPVDPTSLTAPGLAMTAGGVLTIVQQLFNTKAIVPALGTITADVPIIDATVIWNNASVVFHGLKVDITDTASDSTSRVIEALVNTSPVFRLLKNAQVTLFGALTLSGAPTSALHAATKAYVDGRIIVPTVEIFATSGTWTKNASLLYAKVYGQGSGAGGGGVDLASAATSAAGGGGSGAYSESILAAGVLGATETVTIGAAGVGGVTGGAAGQDGVDGGTVSFGTHIVAVGGLGGKGTTTNGEVADGGLGGPASGGTGTIKIDGDDGEAGSMDAAGHSVGGTGAGGKLGSRSRAVRLVSAGTAVGTAGKLYGGAGAGASAFGSATLVAGGAGALGVIIVENHLA